MSEMLIDQYGNQIWYDLKSNEKNIDERIWQDIEYSNETIFWVRLHREDDPAFVNSLGQQWYYIQGKKHREDGPAKILSDGDYSWYLNNFEYTFEEWCEILEKSEEEINFLKLKWNIL